MWHEHIEKIIYINLEEANERRQQIEREVKKEMGVKENPKEPSKCEPKDYMYRRIIDHTMPNYQKKYRPAACTCRCTTRFFSYC